MTLLSRNWMGKKRAKCRENRRARPPRLEQLEARILLDTTPTGYSPAQIRHAYALDQIGFLTSAGAADPAKYNATAGLGQTIAIVDAYDDASLASDLHQFDLAYGLPDPPSFQQLNQSGGSVKPASALNTGWGVETSLDVEWSHALAPAANIVVVEGGTDLLAAVQTAADLPGVSVVSMSFGVGDSLQQLFSDRFFTTPSGHQGVVFFGSSGDSGAPPIFPSDSPNVVSVGGTTLKLDATGNILSESGWDGSGGGTSSVEASAAFQNGVLGQGTAGRSSPDIALDADPNTGVSLFDSLDLGTDSPWAEVGGTSFSAPAWAALTAIADQARLAAGKGTLSGSTQLLPLLYQLPSSDFNDISTGLSQGFPVISAVAGYDQVTGIGTPIANKLIPDLVAYSAPTTHTTIYWTNASGDSNWDNPVNWSYVDPAAGVALSAGVLPGPRNDVVIDLPQAVVHHSAANYDTLHSLSITVPNASLDLSAGSLDLSSGTGALGALAGSQLGNTITLRGGVLRNALLPAGTDVVIPASSTAILDGGVFAGTIQVNSGGLLALQGAWTNNGTIDVAAGATVYLGDSPDFDDAWNSSPTDPGAASHTWVNNGTINLSSDTVYLGGLLSNAAASVGGLGLDQTDTIFLDGTLVNAGSTLALTSNWTIDGGRIAGGNLVIPAGNSVVVNANGGYFQGLSGITLNGTLDLEGSPLQGFLEVSLNTVGGNAILTIDNSAGPVTVAGTGTILFGASDSSGLFFGGVDPRTGAAAQVFVVGNTLTLSAGIKVQGAGTDTFGDPEYGILNGSIVNLGTIDATDVGELDLAGTFVNQGTIEVTGGGFMLTSGVLSNVGTIQETSGGYVSIDGALDNKGAIKETGGGTIAINFDQYDPTNADSQLANWTNEKNISVTSGYLYLGGLWTNAAAGKISAAAGATLQLGDDFAFDPTTPGASLDTWINNGAITAANANVHLGGLLTSALTNLGGLHLTTDDLYLSGTYLNTGKTFVLKTAGGFNGSWVSVDVGLVYQGTVSIPAGNTFVDGFHPTFQDLTAFNLAGTLDLESPDGFSPASLNFENSNTPLTISGAGSITFGLSGVAGFFGFTNPNQISITGKPLTIASGVTISMPGVESDGSVDFGLISGPLVNQGVIGGNQGGNLSLSDLLDNQGTISVGGAGTLSINFDLFNPADSTTTVTTWTNEGQLQAAGGTLQLGGAWTNKAAGTISATSASALYLGDALSFDPSSSPSAEADAWVNNGSLSANAASVYIGGWATYASTSLGGLDLSTDDLYLVGTLQNAGQFLAFNSSGTFKGGWIAINGGSVFEGNVVIPAGVTATIGSAGAAFRDLDSFRLNGTLNVINSDGAIGANVLFDNAGFSLTISGAGVITFGESDASSLAAPEVIVTGNALTIAPKIEVETGVGSTPATIATLSGPLVNQGTIVVDNGGELVFDNLLDNQGTIQATNSSTVLINSDKFDPTTLASLETWTNEGTLEASSNSVLVAGGSWTNSATGAIKSLAGASLQLGDDINVDPVATPAGKLDAWINQGVITATDGSVYLGGWLTDAATNFGGLDLSTDHVILEGTLDNEGQTLTISSSTSVDGNFVIDFGEIHGGVVQAVGPSSVISYQGELDGVTLDGTLTIPSADYAIIINGLTLNGQIQIGDASGAQAVLYFDDSTGPQTVSGTGSIVFGTADNSTGIVSPNELDVYGGGLLTIAAGVTVTGPGVDAAKLAESGLIAGPLRMLGALKESAGGTVTVVGPLLNLAVGTLTGGTWQVSDGTLQLPSSITANAAAITIDGANARLENGAGSNALASLSANLAGGVLNLGPGDQLALSQAFSNAGTVQVASGATFSDIGPYTQTAGLTLANGLIDVATLGLLGGALHGTGTVKGDVTNAGVVSPNDTPGTLTVQGNYTQSAGGALSLVVDATGNSTLKVSGNISLDGTLAVKVANAYAPPAGSPLTLVTFGQRLGSSDFATETGLGIVGQQFSTLTYGNTSLTLTEIAYALNAKAVALSPAYPPPGLHGTIATFTDTNPSDTPASFTVSIDWGDGTPVDATSGVITFANGVYTVVGSHAYTSPILSSGTLTVSVTISSLSVPGATAAVSTKLLTGSLGGVIFDDANANGLLDAGELGLSGRTVFLDLNHNATLDPGEPTAVSDDKGNYQFQHVIPGFYTLALASLPDDSATNRAGVYLPSRIESGAALTSQNYGILNAFGPLPVSTDPNPFGTNNPDRSTAIVHGLYVQILGRTPDATGLAFWTNALTAGAFTSGQVASELFHSAEYAANEIQSLYRSILGRAPNSPEVGFWVAQMTSGLDATGLALAFAKSDEFNNRHGTNESFIQAVYADLLGRGVDAGALAFWTQRLGAGVDRGAVAEAVISSDELYQRAVDNFYEDFFGRSGDGFGMSIWVDNLKSKQMTLTGVALAFLGSAEFQGRAAQTVGKA
jgi:hypothetical protein